MAEQQPLFNYEKWKAHIRRTKEALGQARSEKKVIDDRIEKLERTHRELLSMKEYVVLDGKALPTPEEAPKEGQQDLPLPPSHTEMIAAVINKSSRMPVLELVGAIHREFGRKYAAHLPCREQIQKLLEEFQTSPQICPESFSVGPCYSPGWKGYIGVKLKKKPYKMPSRTNKFLSWIIDYCRKNGITSHHKAVTRGKLYKAMEKDKPGWAKQYLDKKLHGPVGSILDRVMKGKMAATPIKQVKQGRHVFVWVG